MKVDDLLQMIVDLRFRMWEPDNPTGEHYYFVFEYCPEDGEDVRKLKKFKMKEKKKAYEYMEERKEAFKEQLRQEFVINERVVFNPVDSTEALVAILSTPGLQLNARQSSTETGG